jgi:hypothetical protein
MTQTVIIEIIQQLSDLRKGFASYYIHC